MKNLADYVFDVLDDRCRKDGGEYAFEIYADYRDELGDENVKKILESNDPWGTFYDIIQEAYFDAECYYRKDILDEIRAKLNFDGVEYDDDELRLMVDENMYFQYPEDHFLKQEVNMDIIVDTGDGNYDYTCNDFGPAHCSYYTVGAIRDEASLVWLTRQQGYKKSDLYFRDNKRNDNKYIKSFYAELANAGSHMNALTFLVGMTLEDAIKLGEKLSERNEKYPHVYDASYPNCGHVVLDKNCMCGLYDLWGGGGSLLDIQLDKDVRLPIKYIDRIALDKSLSYGGIKGVYGLCGDAWTDSLKKVA